MQNGFTEISCLLGVWHGKSTRNAIGGVEIFSNKNGDMGNEQVGNMKGVWVVEGFKKFFMFPD